MTMSLSVDSTMGALRRLRSLFASIEEELSDVAQGRAELSDREKLIGEYVQDATTIVARVPPDALGHGYTDVLQTIHNNWREIANNPVIADPAGAHELSALLQSVARARDSIREATGKIGRITLPDRINQWLAVMQTGASIPFDHIVADEVPSDDERRRLLVDFAATANLFPSGTIDARSGIVYRHSTSPFWQVMSVLALISEFGLITLAIVIVCRLGIGGLEPHQTRAVLTSWALLVVGVAVHWAVDRARIDHSRGADGAAPIALVQLLPLATARFSAAAVRVLTFGVAFGGFLYLGGERRWGDAAAAFFVGYSVDSFVALLADRLRIRSAQRIQGVAGPALT